MTKSRLYEPRVRDHVIMYLSLDVNSSTHNYGFMFDGSSAVAAI